MHRRRPNRLITDALREIWHTKSRFLSLFLLSALSVAFLAGLRTTAPDMEYTADRYYDDTKLMDLRVLSTLGLTDEDVSVLAQQEGISAAEGAFTADVVVHLQENDLIIRLHSLSAQGINAPVLQEGRMPENDRECLLEPGLMRRAGLSLGDSIVFDISTSSPEDALRHSRYTVVGVINSSLYLSVERGASSLGTGSVFAFAFLPLEAFTLDVYTEAYLAATGAAPLLSYGDAYDALMDELTDRLEPLSDARAALRHDSVIGEAEEKLADAQKEFDEGEAEANQELTDAQVELTDARKKLDDGWREYRDGQTTLRQETADAEQEIAENQQKLDDALVELQDGEADYAEGLKTWQDGKVDYDDGYAELLDGEAEYGDNFLLLQDAQKDYDEGYATYMDGVADLEDAGRKLEEAQRKLADAKKQIDSGDAALSQGSGQLQALKNSYAAAQQQFAAMLAGVGTITGQAPDKLMTEGLGLSTDPAVLGQQLGGLSYLFGQALAALQPMLDSTPTTDPMYPVLQAQAGGLQGAIAALNTALANLPTQGPAVIGDATVGVVTCLGTFQGILAQTGATIHDVERTLESGSHELSVGYNAYLEGKKEFDQGVADFNDGQAELADAAVELSDARVKLSDGFAELADGRKKLDDGWKDLEEAKPELEDGRIELEDARKKLDDGWVEYQDGVTKLNEAKEDFPREVAKAKRKLTDALVELNDGEADYAQGLVDYEDGKREADEKLSDGRNKINDARRKIRDIDACEWYVLPRNTNSGYVSFQQDGERIGNLASVFPLIFFLVAALVCLTTMTRMVEEQRVQIGALKALGYSKSAIAFKYVGYGFFASFLGGVLGLAVGATVIPAVIFNAWKILYTMPNLIIPFQPGVSILSVLAAVLCVTGTALAACLATLRAVPAELMRPRAPQIGKRVLLERIGPVWRHLSFTWKVTVRNLFRYKKRFWMTVIGIGGCTALIIAGFGLRDSIYDVLDKQFDEIYVYNSQVGLVEDVTDAELAEIGHALDTNANVTNWMPSHQVQLSIETPRRSVDGCLFAVADEANFASFIHLRHRLDNDPVVLDGEGAVLTEKLASMLGVKVGDSVILDGDTRVEVPVLDITENYIYHYVYLSHDYYLQVYGQEPPVNMILTQYAEDTTQASDAVSSTLIPLSGVTNVSRIRDNRDTFTKSMESVDYAVIIICSAAALAFVVLYNLTNINITERLRELATLKVLGFYDGELSAYVYRENIFLTLFGILSGLVMGKFLHQWLVRTVEIDMLMFGRVIRPMSFLYAVLLTALFSVLVNLAAHRKLKKIDMVESLKTVE